MAAGRCAEVGGGAGCRGARRKEDGTRWLESSEPRARAGSGLAVGTLAVGRRPRTSWTWRRPSYRPIYRGSACPAPYVLPALLELSQKPTLNSRLGGSLGRGGSPEEAAPGMHPSPWNCARPFVLETHPLGWSENCLEPFSPVGWAPRLIFCTFWESHTPHSRVETAPVSERTALPSGPTPFAFGKCR